MVDSPKELAAAAQDWLHSHTFPLWLDRGLDRTHGGFHEMLDLETAQSAADYKRVRVMARQVYVFATAHRLGVAGAADAVRHGLAFLLGPCRHPGGGFITRVHADGHPLDSRRQLYDMAFVLFALGHAYRVLGDTALRDEAHGLLAFLRTRMAHNSGGYVDALEDSDALRSQNPHMHLLEAALVWAVLEPEGPWRGLALELTDLFTCRFFKDPPGVLLEYFGPGLEPLSSAAGRVTEPGHHFEWIWLLDRVAAVCGTPVAGGEALAAFAHRHGFIGRHGLIAARVDVYGVPLGAKTRLWPHTEWLKAEAVTPGGEARLAQSWHRLHRMFDTPVKGLWFEEWNCATGEPRHVPAPASIVYHILLAIEVLMARAGVHPDPFGVG